MSTASKARRDPASRKWRQHKSGVTPQLRALIGHAGGQTPFARAVYGDSATNANKGKVRKWYYGASGISTAEAVVVAESAELPGVQCGELSIDWLFGLSDEPNRNARTVFGQLPNALAAYVGREFVRRVPRDSVPSSSKKFWNAFVSYWRTDSEAIIEQAIERELEAFRGAAGGLDELAASQRSTIEKALSDGYPDPGPTREESREQRQANRRESQRHRGGYAAMIARQITYAEFVRRVNESGVPLIYDPGLFDRQRAELMTAKATADPKAAEEKTAPAKQKRAKGTPAKRGRR